MFALATGVPSALGIVSMFTSGSEFGEVRANGTAGGGIARVVEISTGDGVETGTSPTGSIVPEGCGLGSDEARGWGWATLSPRGRMRGVVRLEAVDFGGGVGLTRGEARFRADSTSDTAVRFWREGPVEGSNEGDGSGAKVVEAGEGIAETDVWRNG